MKAPFPWFGGKSRVAEHIWRRFGTVRNYVEPFAGSLAVLLSRPQPFEGTETVNDVNGWLCNFWRALQADPDAVAHYADWPVSELDLHARGDWLFYRAGAAEFIERLRSDPDYYDAKSAGWWVWGQSCWIGHGWGPRQLKCQLKRQLKRQRPHLGNAGTGVHRQRPHLGDAGMGVHRKLPHLGDAGGDEPQTSRGTAILGYLRQLAERLRGVRICCGDWSRVCGHAPTVKQGLTALFLDPPYGVEDRDDCYGDDDDRNVAGAVREWCLEHSDDPRLRIVYCGYREEGQDLEATGWRRYDWSASGGYSARENANRHRESIWFSPSVQHAFDEQAMRQATLI